MFMSYNYNYYTCIKGLFQDIFYIVNKKYITFEKVIPYYTKTGQISCPVGLYHISATRFLSSSAWNLT